MSHIDLSTVKSLASQLSADDKWCLMSHLASELSGQKGSPPPQTAKPITWLTAGGIAPGLVGMDAQEWVDQLRQGWSERFQNLVGDAE
jgi:hypothetical protein